LFARAVKGSWPGRQKMPCVHGGVGCNLGNNESGSSVGLGLQTEHSFLNADAIPDGAKPFIIPIVGLVIGAAMMQGKEKVATIGKLVLYFGAQSFMNIFMGWVMRTNVTLKAGSKFGDRVLEHDLTGCPAGFALTAFQQLISFIIFMTFFAAAWNTQYRYTPKKLNSKFEVMSVLIFGCVFALNIALNNFSLGYISIAVNLIIRSCLPLTTFCSQQILSLFDLYPRKPCKPLEISLMVIGVLCAGAFTTAKIMGSGHAKESGNMVLGCVMCIASLLCGSLNLALAGVLGETKLNVYDTVAYMAIPAFVFLLPIACFLQKPVPGEWGTVFGKSKMTDVEILFGVWKYNKVTILWLVVSGVFSFIYNIIQFSIVHTLSPSATAFGGNFNKAALVFLTLMLPFLRVHELPGMPYIAWIWGSVVCNICAFSTYSWLQIKAKEEAAAAQKAREMKDGAKDEEESESESDDEDSYASSSDGKAYC